MGIKTSKTTRLTARLRRCLRDWDPKADGPLIEIGTLVEAFPGIPGTMWQGALADTTADGHRAARRPGIEGRLYQGIRIGILARGLAEWLAVRNSHMTREQLEEMVDRLVRRGNRKRAEARAESARGVREAFAAKREQKTAEKKPAAPKSVSPRITSDALFKVW